jgi:hypothetical protein
MNTRTQLICLLLIALFGGCIEEFPAPIRSQTPRLVIEGLLTNQPQLSTVRVTYTTTNLDLRDLPSQAFENRAVVLLTDDQKQQIPFRLTAPGLYQPTSRTFVGQAGRTYILTVQLANGERYVSEPETMMAPVPMKRIHAQYVGRKSPLMPGGLLLFVDIADPAGQANFYRWTVTGWRRRRATGECCDRCQVICNQYCWTPFRSLGTFLADDRFRDGAALWRQQIMFSPVYTFGGNLFEVRQYSLSREAYQFWQRFGEQQTRTGSILDPIPSTIDGNMISSENPDKRALGYFSASAVQIQRQQIYPDSVGATYNDIYREELSFIEQGGCTAIYPGATQARPAGW